MPTEERLTAISIGRAKDHVQTRVLAHVVAAARRLLGEPVRGQGDELVSLEAQEARGIAGEDPPHGAKQARVAVPRPQRGGEVPRDPEQGRQGL